jgi:hypothetical protein
MERAGDRQGKMERCCSTGQSPQWAVAPTEEEGEEEEVNTYLPIWQTFKAVTAFVKTVPPLCPVTNSLHLLTPST